MASSSSVSSTSSTIASSTSGTMASHSSFGSPTVSASISQSIGSLMSNSCSSLLEKSPCMPSSTKIVLLDLTNYLLWESQIIPILKSQRLILMDLMKYQKKSLLTKKLKLKLSIQLMRNGKLLIKRSCHGLTVLLLKL
ncbi:hypothetical protein C5167_047128 [Papaver somniferum]|uniref:Uncharacterized protein n=1 Tax=Papaver somniferum TaxID=3469 RepID=A0A4Y7LHZ5_PAPSO|nr:hypothetical protein C5167_047128 [Papaver somniferum]